MEIVLLIIAAIVIFIVIRIFSNATASPDDPKPMSNQHLLSAIAGQADALEKISRAPIETQKFSSIAELTKKRKSYIAQLCMEVVERGIGDGGPNNQELKYPGASVAVNVFYETSEYAKELEATGISKENSAVRAVKEKLFKENGYNYFTKWEI